MYHAIKESNSLCGPDCKNGGDCESCVKCNPSLADKTTGVWIEPKILTVDEWEEGLRDAVRQINYQVWKLQAEFTKQRDYLVQQALFLVERKRQKDEDVQFFNLRYKFDPQNSLYYERVGEKKVGFV